MSILNMNQGATTTFTVELTDGAELGDALITFLSGQDVQPLSSSTRVTSTTSGVLLFTFPTDRSALGHTLGWLLLNRSSGTNWTLTLNGAGGAEPIYLLPCTPSRQPAYTLAGPPVATHTVPSDPSCYALNGRGAADPSKCCEVFHLHCHFNSESLSEPTARALLASTAAAVDRAGEVVLNTHVWIEKNGPHDPWSWELWVNTPGGLGAAATHMMEWVRPSGAGAMGLHLSLHADTDQEHSDHTLRLAWVGPADPRGLDVDFFPLPPKDYEGPHLYARKSCASKGVLYSMGSAWALDGEGKVQRDAYGAQDRDD